MLLQNKKMLPTAVGIGVLYEDEGGGGVMELEMTETGVNCRLR